MFVIQQPRRQRLGIVVCENIDHDLTDRRPAVQFGRDEMHAGAVCRIARVECALMRAKSGIFRQQRRMNIDDASAPCLDDIWIDHAHESCEHDEIRTEFGSSIEQRTIERGATCILFRIQGDRGDARFLRDSYRACIGFVTQQCTQFDRQFPRALRIEQRREVGAAS